MSANLPDPTSWRKMKIINLLFVGLKDSGKTALAFKTLTRSPDPQHSFGSTKGCALWNEVEYNNVVYNLWETECDTGFDLYLPGDQMHGLIYVVDSSNRMNIVEARQYLMKVLQNQRFDSIPLQILANKQDLPDVMTAEEIIEKLKLNELENRKWNVKPTDAINEAGRYDTLEWLSTQI